MFGQLIPTARRALTAGVVSLVLSVLTQWLSVDNVILLDVFYALGALPIALALRSYGRAGNMLIVVQSFVVILFSGFSIIVLNIIDHIGAEPAYDFYVFSGDGVATALALNMFATGISFLVYGAFPRLGARSTVFQISEGMWISDRKTSEDRAWVNALLLISWVMIIAVGLLTPNVLQYSYPENAGQPGDLPPTIRVFLVLIPLAALISASVAVGYRTSALSVLARITFYAAVFFVGIMEGSRGAMTGLLIVVTMVDIVFCKATMPVKSTIVVIDVLYAMFLVVNWPQIRVTASEIGFLPSLLDSFRLYDPLIQFKSFRLSDVYLSDIPMLGQSLFHYLYVVNLIDSGVSLGYQTFINLLPQQLPEILDGVLWARPLNDSWILAEYFGHGGGFYAYANAYWNGGIVPLALFAFALAWCAAKIELMFKGKNHVFAIAYFAFVFLVPVNMYYGIQGLSRGLEYGLIAYFAVKFWDARRIKNQTHGARAVPSTLV